MHWIIWQWPFRPILLPWNARFLQLLVLGKYSYVLGQHSNPADEFPLLLKNHVHQSIAHVRIFKWKGAIHAHLINSHFAAQFQNWADSNFAQNISPLPSEMPCPGASRRQTMSLVNLWLQYESIHEWFLVCSQNTLLSLSCSVEHNLPTCPYSVWRCVWVRARLSISSCSYKL